MASLGREFEKRGANTEKAVSDPDTSHISNG